MPTGAVDTGWLDRKTVVTTTVVPATTNYREFVPLDEPITVDYSQSTAVENAEGETVECDELSFEIVTGTDDPVAPGSLWFTLGGKQYIDRDGQLYTDHDHNTGAASLCGAIDYANRRVTLTTWVGGTMPGVTIHACATITGEVVHPLAAFRTPTAPLRPESLQITATADDGTVITGTADAAGVIDGTHVQGYVDNETGAVDLWFTTDGSDDTGASDVPVFTDTGRYNAVAFSYLPLDASIIGIDPVRMPSDGRVPIFMAGDAAMIMHTETTAPQAVSNGTTIATRPRVAWVRLLDAAGETITEGYSLDRATGTVTIDDASGMVGPVTVRHTIGDLRLVTDVQINGTLTLARPLSHDFPAGSIVSSCLLHGDRRARVSAVWDEQTWSGEWVDSIQGDAATATLNVIDYPITVTNEGCDTDRWVLRCLNSSTHQWELISEARGRVWSGTYEPGGADVEPINPRTRVLDEVTGTYVGGAPYMTIPGQANGGGWSTGNVVRINTVGAIADVWIARAIQQSDQPLDDGADGAEIYVLGNVDRP